MTHIIQEGSCCWPSEQMGHLLHSRSCLCRIVKRIYMQNLFPWCGYNVLGTVLGFTPCWAMLLPP